MGNYPSNHIRIWNELSQIENESLRLGMVEKLINAPEYIQSMKRAGVYVDVITWVTAIRRGQWANWPKYTPVTSQPPPTGARGPQGQLAKVPPAKRAMDYLHEAYDILGLSDDAALSPGMLKSAYYRKSKEHHPDKGGDPEKFKKIQGAYEVLSDDERRRMYDMTGQMDGQQQQGHGHGGGMPFGFGGMPGMPFGFATVPCGPTATAAAA